MTSINAEQTKQPIIWGLLDQIEKNISACHEVNYHLTNKANKIYSRPTPEPIKYEACGQMEDILTIERRLEILSSETTHLLSRIEGINRFLSEAI